MTKLVSVIIPAYNAEKYIKTAIESILQQSYRNLEVIVVDDGSKDGTFAVVSEFSDPRLKIIRTDNHGQSAACNRGFLASSGELVKFFDADDILNENFIASQVLALNDSTDCIASSKWGRFFHDDLSTFNLNTEMVWRTMKPIDWLVESLTCGGNMLQCAIWLIPRPVLEKSGLWNPLLTLNNDFDFFVRVLLASSEIRFCPDAILYYRSGMVNSLSRQTSEKAWESAVVSNLLGIDAILSYENSERTCLACANNVYGLMVQTFPKFKRLSKQVELKIEELGGAKVNCGRTPLKNLIVKLVGWKKVRYWRYYLGNLK